MSEGLPVDCVEVFSSFQGEGPYVGAATLFVRLGRCDLRCAWCDSPGTWLASTRCRIETGSGSGRFHTRESPIGLDALWEEIERLDGPAHAFVSLTGGEPLLQPEAVREIARRVRARGGRVLLETHGLAFEALERVVAEIDVVSMDWKLASDVRRASDPKGAVPEPFHDAHERFLTVAHAPGGGREVVVKVVVTPATRDEELDELCRRIAGVDPGIPLVLQPVTPFGSVKRAPTPEQLLAWQRRCRTRLRDVRVIPQTHKAVGAL